MSDPSRLPDFIAVGPQRTGTTWLHKVLRPHLSMPVDMKETDFFLRNYARGMKWYLSFFRTNPDAVRGEVDPNYFGAEVARERIAKDLPRAKIVVTLRDPTDRAYSSYRVMRRDVWTKVGVEETISRNPVIRESSRYAHHLAAWQRAFGKDRVLICFYDDLEPAPQAYLDRITEFIGAPRIVVEGSPIASERINAVTAAPRNPRLAARARNIRAGLSFRGLYRVGEFLERVGFWKYCFERGEEFAELDPEIDARLREHFRPEVEALEALVGRDLSAWKTGPRIASAPAPAPRSSASA